ncbi:ATP-binding protein [Streptomyces sp. NPDC002758]
MTSAPPVTRGVATAGDGLCRERQDLGRTPGRPRLTRDVASVSFRITPGRAGQAIAEPDARRVQMTRRVTAARLNFLGLGEFVDDVTLVVSELVTNAIVHSGGSQITYTMAVRDGFLRLSVHDEMPGCPQVRNAGGDAERGRGLFLVECIAEAHGGEWGTSDEGASTWCSLALPEVQK